MLIESGLHDFEDFSPVATGVYDFVIKDPMEVIPIVDEKTDIGGKKYTFIIWPEIIAGDLAGKKVRRQFSNGSKGSRYFLKSFLEKIGVSISKEGAFSSESLLGKRFRCGVGARGYKDSDGNSKIAADLETESAIAL